MSEKELKARIAELEKVANEAYRRRDFVSENRYDAERARLQRLLDDMQVEKPLTESDLIPHDWDQVEISRYGNTRCRVCHMQYRYFREGLASLSGWPEAEKGTTAFNETMRLYSCKST